MEAEDLTCSLCLDLFSSPVRITRCGHSFCGQCLTSMTATLWPCPECRVEQNQKPEDLARNYFLERTIEKFKDSRKKICTTHDLKKKLRKLLRVACCESDVSELKLMMIFGCW